MLRTSGIIFFLWKKRDEDSTDEVVIENVDNSNNNDGVSYLDNITVNYEESVINIDGHFDMPEFGDEGEEVSNPSDFFIMQVEE